MDMGSEGENKFKDGPKGFSLSNLKDRIDVNWNVKSFLGIMFWRKIRNWVLDMLSISVSIS